MKLTAPLILLGFLHVSATGFSQNVTLSLKNASLEKVFTEIEKQTGYNFIYFQNQLEKTRAIDVDAVDLPLAKALELVFKDQPLTYSIEKNFIVVKQKPSTVVGVNTNNTIVPPPGDIHGHISDSLGHPLEGASVSVKGEKHGAQTDRNGDFNLKGVADNATLIISNVGYESQTIKLSGGREVRIALKQSMSKLDETVVKGYYNTTERLNTGDVTTVKGEDIQEQPVSDPILALEGRVPGLNIQQTSGIPGAYSTIRIQGLNSIANGSNPLYVVDGVPYSSTSTTSPIIGGGALGISDGALNQTGVGASPFNFLNPAEIESITVLKDADATAIYGSRGANGVILITTKKGKAGHTQFDLNGFAGTGKVTRMMSLMNTPEYLEMRHQALNNDGLSPDPNSDFDLTYWDTTRYTNWQKVLIGKAAQFDNLQGNLSGGNANTQFLIGAGYGKQATVYPGSYSDQKSSVNLSLNHTSTDQRLHVILKANYVYDNSSLPQSDFTGSVILAPDAPALYASNGSLNWEELGGSATWQNPLSSTLLQAKAMTDNLISNLNASYLILPGLQLRSNFGYSHTQTNQNIITPASSYPPPYNTFSAYRTNFFATTDFKTWIIEPQISYDRQIAQGRLGVLVGSTFQQNTQNENGFLATGFASDALIQDPQAATSTSIAGYNNVLYHYDALYGRINYDWQEKYLLNLTARRDGSSRFGPGRQFGNFGAVGAGWIFSKENFVTNTLPFLSFGKLRASYGVTGNDQIADYQFLSTYTPYHLSYEGMSGLYPTRLPNSDFGWEEVKKLEVGLELGFLKDRIALITNYFYNRTGNQLVGYPLPHLAGFNSVQANLPAIVQNTGGEFTLNTVNIKSSHFTWTSSVNLTIPENKLVAYPNLSSSGYANTYAVGHSLFAAKVFAVADVNDTTGVYQYQSSKSGPTYNPNYPGDLIVTKPITQQWYGGMQNSFSYKGFRLDVFFQYVRQLGYNYFGAVSYASAGTFNTNFPTAVLSRWQKTGNVSKYGLFSTQGAADPAGYLSSLSTFIISDASFGRLKNLALSYQLPKALLQKEHIEMVRFYVQCQNLFTITHYLGFDPETGGNSLPPIRMITGGIQVTL